VYAQHVNVGNTTSFTISSLPDGTYYFAVQAYSSSGLASPASNQVVVTLGSTQGERTWKVTDLNADGRNDLLWQNQATGALSVWRMQGTILIGGVSLSPAVVPPAWKIVGALDANHDGQADLLWQHDSGYVSIWLMSGETMQAAVELTASAAADPRWRIVGTGDMDRDGHVDILWQHLDGTFAVWYMDGPQLRPGSAMVIGKLSDSSWRLVGAEDFDRDGHLDFLWHHAVTGQVAIWRMNDRTLLDGTLLEFSVGDVDWQIEATTDLNNDAKPDLIWRNTRTGDLAAWMMDGLHFNVENGVWLNPGRVSDVNWRIVGPR
jgi:hypothetical protein